MNGTLDALANSFGFNLGEIPTGNLIFNITPFISEARAPF